MPSPSHHIFNGQIINTLALRGYNITVLSPDFDSSPPENVHYLKVSEIHQNLNLVAYLKHAFEIKDTSVSPLESLYGLRDVPDDKS